MAIRADEIDIRSGAVDMDRDRLLVLRHQRGDVEAFEELYRRYHERLVAYCTRRVGDRHTAEELAQEAFVKALRAMPRFAGERRFYPWMTVIAQRLCIDHHRRSSRVEPTAEPDAGAVEADHDAVFDAVDRDHLELAMDRLAPRHREIIDLRERRGWSYQQIATHLDVPMTTVEALLHRARKALRREYLAVAGDDRAGRFGLALLGGGLLTRLKAWVAAATPDKWAPVIGTAAAGIAAVGMVAGPLHTGDDGSATDQQLRESVSVTSTSSWSTDGATPSWGPVGVTAPAPAATPAAGASGRAATPDPIVDNRLVVLGTDRAGAEAATEENRTQPLGVELPGGTSVGVDPVEAIDRLLEPYGGLP